MCLHEPALLAPCEGDHLCARCCPRVGGIHYLAGPRARWRCACGMLLCRSCRELLSAPLPPLPAPPAGPRCEACWQTSHAYWCPRLAPEPPPPALSCAEEVRALRERQADAIDEDIVW